MCIAELHLLFHTWFLCRNIATIPLLGTAGIVFTRDSGGLSHIHHSSVNLALLYLKVWLSRMYLRTFCAIGLSMRSASCNTSSNLNIEMMGWSRIPCEANICTAPCSLSITTMASVTFNDFKRGFYGQDFRLRKKRLLQPSLANEAVAPFTRS